MREDVEFSAEGVPLRGWLYRPEGAAGPAPVVVALPGGHLDADGKDFGTASGAASDWSVQHLAG